MVAYIPRPSCSRSCAGDLLRRGAEAEIVDRTLIAATEQVGQAVAVSAG